MNESAASPFAKIVSVLDRREEIPALEALISAFKSGREVIDLSKSAIVLDANVLLRIPAHKKSADIMDYLGTVHKKPIIVPGQIIQEFWNNHLGAVNSIYKTISKKHAELAKEVEKIRKAGIIGIDGINEALDAFKIDNEHVFEPELVSKTTSFLERLLDKAAVPFAPRSNFYEMAMHRKKAKTPPGFKDEGDGDFLVWVDLLWGLVREKDKGAKFDNVILVSNDEKVDWCRGESAHPVLYAELKAVLNAHFEIWTLDHFAERLSG